MRKDMKKVLCESPRSHSFDCYGYIRASENRGDYDDLPSYQGMRRPYVYGHKEFTDHITPLLRYLWTCVGRPYDDVWSEICATVPSSNTVDRHLIGHVRDEIDTNVTIINDDPYVLQRYGDRYEKPRGLYVDPRDGLIHAGAVDRHHSYRSGRHEKVKLTRYDGGNYSKGDDGILYPITGWGTSGKYPVKPISKEKEAVKINGIWYTFVFAIVPAPKVLTIYENGKELSKMVKFPQQDILNYNYVSEGRYRAKKFQMSSAELRKYGLKNDR